MIRFDELWSLNIFQEVLNPAGADMRINKKIAVVAMASLFFWTPTLLPASARPIGCGVVTWSSFDTAFARALPLPCPTPAHGPTFIVFGIIASAFSVMFDAAIVWNTQCRELTTDEAIASASLPLLGMAFNKNDNKCHQ